MRRIWQRFFCDWLGRHQFIGADRWGPYRIGRCLRCSQVLAWYPARQEFRPVPVLIELPPRSDDDRA